MAEETLTGLTGAPASNDTTTISPVAPAPVAPTTTTDSTMGLPKIETPKIEEPKAVVDPSAGQLGLPKAPAPIEVPPPAPVPTVDITQEAPMALETNPLAAPVDETMGLVTKDSAEQTKIIEKLGSDVIDPTGKTVEGIQDEIAERQKEIFLRDTARQNQLNMEQYSQKLAQEGFGGSGARESLILMLEASNANNTATGLQQLQLANLQRKSGEAAKQEAAMQMLFSQTMESGNTKEALELANQLAANDPENPYWQYVSNNPEAMAKMNDVNYQAKLLANRTSADDIISRLDFTAPGSIQAKYGDWKNYFFDSDEAITTARLAAWDDISQEDKDRIYEEEIGAPRTGMMNDAEKNEVYAKWRFDKKVSNAETGLISDTIYKDLKANNVTDENLEAIQNGVNYLLADPNATPLSLDGMTFLPGDLQGRKAEHLFENWSGEDYNLTTNKWTERTQFDLDMDTMWKSYVKGLGDGEMPPSHKDFIIAAREAGYVEGEPVSAKAIKQSASMQGKNAEKSELMQIVSSYTGEGNIQSLDTGEMLELISQDGVNAYKLVTELGGLKDYSTASDPRTDRSDGTEIINSYNKDFGVEAAANGTYPRYAVFDGVMYRVGDVNKGTKNFYWEMTPVDQSQGAKFNLDTNYRNGLGKDSVLKQNPDGTWKIGWGRTGSTTSGWDEIKSDLTYGLF
tara:strand:+ start:18226 stop:20277 length:2052 start_codon:yes stop_codon:yes gene_type:complete